jgi:hypothetical protein
MRFRSLAEPLGPSLTPGSGDQLEAEVLKQAIGGVYAIEPLKTVCGKRII